MEHKALPPRPEPKGLLGPAVMLSTATHESFIMAIRDAVAARLTDPAAKARVLNAKFMYGVGFKRGTRGGTFYDAWENGSLHHAVEICAMGEESPIQLAGTTIHECGHLVAGNGAGHSGTWKTAAGLCGLRHAEAAGQDYKVEDIDPAMWTLIQNIPAPGDGVPLFKTVFGRAFTFTPRPCPAGIGVRGGTSRGIGSGSRLIRVACPAEGCGYVIRMARRWIDDPAYGTPCCPAHTDRMVAAE